MCEGEYYIRKFSQLREYQDIFQGDWLITPHVYDNNWSSCDQAVADNLEHEVFI